LKRKMLGLERERQNNGKKVRKKKLKMTPRKGGLKSRKIRL